MNKAVFLDRDNTIIEDKQGYIDDPEKVIILPGVAEAVRFLNENNFLVIITTNQSGIARGLFDEKTFGLVNSKMFDFLNEQNAKIDDLFYCPHLPEGQIPQYSKVCTCRKPLPGLIIQAVEKYDIDLTQSYMIGDSKRDIEAGINAGCKTILLSGDSNITTEADQTCADLLQAVEYILTATANRHSER